MKKRTRITAEMVQQMKKLRTDGKSTKEIAEVIGVSVTSVKKHTAGIKVLVAEKQALIETVRKMYLEGKTYTQIADETGVSSPTIRGYTRGLPRRKGNPPSHRTPPEKIAQARKLRAQGKSYEVIAGLLGISWGAVRRYTRDIPTKKPEPPTVGQPETLCRHKEACRYWRPLSGLGGGISACHYPIDRDELRPWPADQCPGFPGPKTGPNPTPMGIKPRREKP